MILFCSAKTESYATSNPIFSALISRDTREGGDALLKSWSEVERKVLRGCTKT